MSAVQAEHRVVSNGQRLAFWLKTRLFIARRLIENSARRKPNLCKNHLTALGQRVLLAESITPLYNQTDPREQELELGKVQNLRTLARLLDGTIIPQNQVFSFWQQVGRPTRRKGFVVGRELRHGCLVPTIAGGICQFTNALSGAARRAGAEIVEQHLHSAVVEGLQRHDGEDATVFWNYVDFQFRAHVTMRLKIHMTTEHLIIRLEPWP
jgi:vancomycin resistance protein YoaR